MTPDARQLDAEPNANPERPVRMPPPLVLHAITGPTPPDMSRQVEESRRRHEEQIAKAERLVAQARSGSIDLPQRTTEPRPLPLPGEYRLEMDWRGETAIYVEHDRRVRMECFYWGGPNGSVSHIHGMWEYTDGRSEPLTPAERALTLERVIEYARRHEDITLESSGE